jgi:hypothetical protein
MPSFCEARGQGRDDDPWWTSPEAQRLHASTGQKLFGNSDASTYSLGHDFFGPFDKKDHSTGLFLLRCEDMHPQQRGKRCFHMPLLIIAGPKQPEYLDPYLHLILEELQRYGPDGKSVVQ